VRGIVFFEKGAGNMNIILPTTLVPERMINKPLFYLAGYAPRAGSWQENFCIEMEKLAPGFFAACPCLWQASHGLYKHRVMGAGEGFEDLTSWEFYYMSMAEKLSKKCRGCIVFWLSSASKNCYSQLGYCRGKFSADRSMGLVVGIEQGFPDSQKIRREFRLVDENFRFCHTLAGTVRRAGNWIAGR